MSGFYNKIGIIGAGSFGSAIAQIASTNVEEVVVYVRSEDRLQNFNIAKQNKGYPVADNVRATMSMQEITEECVLLLAVVPAKNFRNMVRSFSPYLQPDHIMIHGTKGLDVRLPAGVDDLHSLQEISRHHMATMSEVIAQESSIKRVGCLAGPNLSAEMQEGQPAGAIVASLFEEVKEAGKACLNSEVFKIFYSNDLLGAEFAGVLKNIFAIASGILTGLDFGNNAKALLITKGLHEMLYLGKHLGAESSAFLGIAGIGDMVATCSSPLSRNFTVGKKISEGKTLHQIAEEMTEVAEGIRSVKIFTSFCNKNNLKAPLTEMLHKILFEDKPPLDGLTELMNFKYNLDVDFL